MCGRYTVRRVSIVHYGLGAAPEVPFEEFDERPRFNVAPSQFAPIIRLNAQGVRAMRPARWGLVPHWTKGAPKTRPINARCETAATSGMFRQPMDRRRCLIPVDGFFEWRGAKPPKQPFFIHMKDDGPFAFAGLWERWRESDDAEPVDTYTVLTTSPNDVMRPIHDRMPVILDPADYGRWLDREVPGAGVADLLKPFDATRMEAYPVSTRVNNTKNDGPELVERVEE